MERTYAFSLATGSIRQSTESWYRGKNIIVTISPIAISLPSTDTRKMFPIKPRVNYWRRKTVDPPALMSPCAPEQLFDFDLTLTRSGTSPFKNLNTGGHYCHALLWTPGLWERRMRNFRIDEIWLRLTKCTIGLVHRTGIKKLNISACLRHEIGWQPLWVVGFLPVLRKMDFAVSDSR